MSDYDFDEDVSEGDVKEATGGKYPVGKFICRVSARDVIPMEKMEPPCYGQAIELTIIEALEIDKKPATDKNRHTSDGIILKDEVPMPKAGEKEWVKKKRTAVAVALKLIPPTGGPLNAEKWAKALGRTAIIETDFTRRKNDSTGKWEPTDFVAIKMFGEWAMAETPEPAIDLDAI